MRDWIWVEYDQGTLMDYEIIKEQIYNIFKNKIKENV